MGSRLYGLDLLRGIAAIMVVALHLCMSFGIDKTLFSRAYLAVDFFFVLSGYVMARTYEPDMDGFLIKRYFRLWPPMVVAAIIVVVQLFVSGMALPGVALFTLPLFLMLPNLLTRGTRFGEFPVNMPAWSIFAELVANALHSVLLVKLGNRQLLAVIALALAGSQAFSLGLDLTLQNGLFKSIPRVIAGYTLGIFLYRNMRLVLHPAIGLIGLPILILLAPFTPPLFDLLFLAACPIFIASGKGQKALTSLSGFAGALSFPLYAVHMPIFALVRVTGGGPVLGLACAGLAAIAVAFLVDGRIRRFIRQTGPNTSLPYPSPKNS